jgi:hypothetical protein
LTLGAPAPLQELAMLTGAVDNLLPTALHRTPKAAAPLAPLSWQKPPPAIAVNLHGRGPQSTHALQELRPTILLAHAAPGKLVGDARRVVVTGNAAERSLATSVAAAAGLGRQHRRHLRGPARSGPAVHHHNRGRRRRAADQPTTTSGDVS